MVEKPSNVPHKSGLFCLILLRNPFKTSEETAWLTVWPCGTNLACKTPLTSKKQMSSEVGLHLTCFLGRGDIGVFHWLDFCFFSGSWLITNYNLRKLIIVNCKLSRTRNIRRLFLLILAIILHVKYWSSYWRETLLARISLCILTYFPFVCARNRSRLCWFCSLVSSCNDMYFTVPTQPREHNVARLLCNRARVAKQDGVGNIRTLLVFCKGSVTTPELDFNLLACKQQSHSALPTVLPPLVP